MAVSSSSLAWLAAWALGFILFIYIEFGAVYFTVTCIAAIFSNLGTKKEGELSAYAAFNKNCAALPGTLDASEFDSHLRHGAMRDASGERGPLAASSTARVVPDRSITEAIAQSGNLSRIGNHPCPCGSGRKTKKCCGAGAALQEVEDEARRRERREAKAARHHAGNRAEF